MTDPLFDRFEHQLRTAAQSRLDRRPTRRLRRGLAASGRALPITAAVAGTVAILVAALALLHPSGASTRPSKVGGHGSVPTLPVPSSPRAQQETKALARVLGPVHRLAICRSVTLDGRVAPRHVGQALRRELSVLNAPERSGAQRTRVSVDLGTEGVLTYPTGTWRTARAADGVTFTLAPVRVLPTAGQPSARCLAAESRALRRGASAIPTAIRAQTVHLGAALIAYERTAISAAPYDSVCLIQARGHSVSTDCPGETPRKLRRVSLPWLESGPPLAHPVFVSVVPDGVASGTVALPARLGHPATIVRGTVAGNVLVIRAPAWLRFGPQALTSETVTWRSPTGRIIASDKLSTPAAPGCPPSRRLQCLLLQVATTGTSAGTTTAPLQTNPG